MRTWRHLATTGCMLAALAQGPTRAADTPAPVVRYSNDALTVRLTHASVTEVLDEIGRQTGAEIRGQVADVREISADFEAVPLPEAIHRLLGTQNFALVYGEKGNLKALELLGEAASGPVTPSRPAPVPSTARRASRIRRTGPSASPTSTGSTSRRDGCGRGAPSSAPTRSGRMSWGG